MTHWSEYLAEAFGLGLFMVSAAGFAILLFHPASPVAALVPDVLGRSLLMGLAMGLTMVLIVYSPWGRRSGAHLNPAFTLTFYRLGKVAGRDVVGYIVSQFFGGLVGMGVAVLFFRPWIADPAVDYVATVPGPAGTGVAFGAEFTISFVLMLTVLGLLSRPGVAPFTGLVVGLLVAVYIALESPLSGMSMNPARTVASAVFAHLWSGLWLYFAAPLFGMLCAGECFRRGEDVQRRFLRQAAS